MVDDPALQNISHISMFLHPWQGHNNRQAPFYRDRWNGSALQPESVRRDDPIAQHLVFSSKTVMLNNSYPRFG
jgi:hypothetical protein